MGGSIGVRWTSWGRGGAVIEFHLADGHIIFWEILIFTYPDINSGAF